MEPALEVTKLFFQASNYNFNQNIYKLIIMNIKWRVLILAHSRSLHDKILEVTLLSNFSKFELTFSLQVLIVIFSLKVVLSNQVS